MKKTVTTFAAIFAIAILAACSSTRPICATSNPVGEKVGKATAARILCFIPISADAGIQKAAKNGDITKISTVDMKTFWIPLLYSSVTTVITGE